MRFRYMTTEQRVQAAIMAVAPHRIFYSPHFKQLISLHVSDVLFVGTAPLYLSTALVSNTFVYIVLSSPFAACQCMREPRHTLTLSLYCSAPPPSTASATHALLILG